MTIRAAALTIALYAMAAPAFAQVEQDTVESLASETEAAGVKATIAKIKCTAETIEKENDNLFEIDDAQCEIGQYDLKLDGAFNIVSMTRD